MRITVVSNSKGGCGKTTTAITLATGLAGLGHKTLLIDLDGQPGNATTFLGLERGPGLSKLIITQSPLAECLTEVPNYPKLRVIVSDQTALAVNSALASQITPARDTLRKALEPLAKDPMHVILDTAPSLSQLQVAALGAADYLLIPTTPEYASWVGMRQVAKMVKELQRHGSAVQFLGVVPVMIDRRTREHKQTLDKMKSTFGTLLYPEVGRAIKLGEAPNQGVPIWKYAPDSQAAHEYAHVLKRFLKDVGLER